MSVDYSMDTALLWAKHFDEVKELPERLQKDPDMIVNIVEYVDRCIRLEWEEDIDKTERNLGRQLRQQEVRDFRHPVFGDYDDLKRTRFLNSVQNLLGDLLPVISSNRSLVNLGLRLWSGCLKAAKILDSVMTYELNKKIALVANIEAYYEQDPIFKAGVSVTCLLMDKRGQSSQVSFVGISPSSPSD